MSSLTPKARNQDNLAIAILPYGDLLMLLSAGLRQRFPGPPGRVEVIHLPQFQEPIPADAEILSVERMIDRHALRVVLRHPSFPLVPMYGPLPIRFEPARLEMVPVVVGQTREADHGQEEAGQEAGEEANAQGHDQEASQAPAGADGG